MGPLETSIIQLREFLHGETDRVDPHDISSWTMSLGALGWGRDPIVTLEHPQTQWQIHQALEYVASTPVRDRFEGDVTPILTLLEEVSQKRGPEEWNWLHQVRQRFGSFEDLSDFEGRITLWGVTYSQEEIDQLVEDLFGPDDDKRSKARDLFYGRAERMIALGFINQSHVDRIVKEYSAPKYKIAYSAYDPFLSRHISDLIDAGLFKKRHLAAVRSAFFNEETAMAADHPLHVSVTGVVYFSICEDLMARGLLEEDELLMIRRILHSEDSRARSHAIDFYDEHLPALLEAGFFSESEYLSILNDLRTADFRFNGLSFIYNHFSTLIQLGYFKQEHEEAIRNLIMHENDKVAKLAIDFYTKYLPTLTQKGWYNQDINFKLGGGILYNKSSVRVASYQFYTAHLPFLIEEGYFNEFNYEAISIAFKSTPKVDKIALIAFFRRHLPLLLKKGWFSRADYLAIVAAPQDWNIYEPAYKFFSTHFPLLILYGLVETEFNAVEKDFGIEDRKDWARRRINKISGQYSPDPDLESWLKINPIRSAEQIGKEAYDSFNQFDRGFHAYKAMGLINHRTLEGLLDAAGVTDEMRDQLENLGTSEEWLFSPFRWKQLSILLSHPGDWTKKTRAKHFDRLTDYEKAQDQRFGALHDIFRELHEEENQSSVEELSHLISVLKDLEPVGVEILASKGQEEREKLARTTRDKFIETVRTLQVPRNIHLERLWDHIETPEGVNLLYDWHLTGMDKTWHKYREQLRVTLESGNPEKQRQAYKKFGKKFLNFVKTQAQRPTPSLARLLAKRGEQIKEEMFLMKLTQSEDPALTEKMEAFTIGPLWNRFTSTRLFQMIAKANGFLSPEGMDSMRRLLVGLRLEEVTIVRHWYDEKGNRIEVEKSEKRLAYPRYEELQGVVSNKFLREWEKEYEAELKEVLGALEGKAGQQASKEQVLSQVGMHLVVPENLDREKIPIAIRNLDERVIQWMKDYAANEELNGRFQREAEALIDIFEVHYQLIREHFGDIFADIRTDLHNYLKAIKRGIRLSKTSERFIVSGDVEIIGRSGSEPVETCQTLERSRINTEGQPIHRMLHGQFKVANWEIDGIVMARRLLEVTVDAEGREHLLVERLYTAGGFGRISEFRKQIINYATEFLGIDNQHIHFSDEDSFITAPPSLQTGDRIYRDTFYKEELTLDEARALRQHREAAFKSLETSSHSSGTADPETRPAPQAEAPPQIVNSTPYEGQPNRPARTSPSASTSFDVYSGIGDGFAIVDPMGEGGILLGNLALQEDIAYEPVGGASLPRTLEASSPNQLGTMDHGPLTMMGDQETILLETIALAEKRGLTEVVHYLEFASDEEVVELFTDENALYRNLIENGYASHASQLSQTGQKVSPHQIVMLNAALVTGSSAEVAQLVEEISPAEVPTEMPGMTVLGAPTGSLVLKPISVLRVVR